MTTQIPWLCPDCEHVTVVTCYPPVKARTYGDPLNCYPGEDAYIEPTACEKCGEPIDAGQAIEEASNKDAADEEYAAECRAERDKED